MEIQHCKSHIRLSHGIYIYNIFLGCICVYDCLIIVCVPDDSKSNEQVFLDHILDPKVLNFQCIFNDFGFLVVITLKVKSIS